MRRTLLAVMLLGLMAGPAIARDTVPIANYINEPLQRADGAALNEARVMQAIFNAAAQRKWSLGYAANGSVTATLVIRNKHTMVVDILYSPNAISMRYRSSINLKYWVRDGVPYIHPAYNAQAKALLDAIKIEVQRV
jgi:hypothetical protein